MAPYPTVSVLAVGYFPYADGSYSSSASVVAKSERQMLDAILGAATTVLPRATAQPELRARVTVEYSAEVDACPRCGAH